jgi:hypothetical protein
LFDSLTFPCLDSSILERFTLPADKNEGCGPPG